MSLFLKKYKILITLSIAALVIVLPFYFFKKNTKTNLVQLPAIKLPQLFTNEVVLDPFAKVNSDKHIFIIHYWASWCAPCTEEFPTILKAADQISNQVQFVAVNLDDDINAAQQFLKKFDYQKKNIIYLWDRNQELSKLYGTLKLPESYILDSQRHLIRKIGGATNWENPKNIEFFKNLKR